MAIDAGGLIGARSEGGNPGNAWLVDHVDLIDPWLDQPLLDVLLDLTAR